MNSYHHSISSSTFYPGGGKSQDFRGVSPSPGPIALAKGRRRAVGQQHADGGEGRQVKSLVLAIACRVFVIELVDEGKGKPGRGKPGRGRGEPCPYQSRIVSGR